MSHDEQQDRGGLVPIGKVAVRLPGIEGRGRAMSARARHHFTTLRQVNAAHRGQRSGARSRVHGAAVGVV